MSGDADFLVVGAGTAGCVLAARLTEDPKVRVTLLEAGGKPASPFVKIPAGFAKLFLSKLDWAYRSTPQTAAGGRSVYIPRGRMLGGSCNMNAQIHQWGHPADFDAWAAGGAPGWSWSDVAPIFLAHEALMEPAEGRGSAGPMRIDRNRHAHPVAHAFVEAAHAAGLPANGDYNGLAFEGAWISQLAHQAGQRFSAYDAFLVPALRRRNLRVVTGAHAAQVLFENGRAVGVRTRDGRIHRARRGVVLAAGAIGSPQLLMLSGVGPGAALQALGIPVVRDAPGVGANLQDHPMALTSFATRRRDTFKAAESPLNLMRYLLAKRGPLASNAVEAIAFARSSPDLAAPDIELLFAPFQWLDEGITPPRLHAFSIGAAVVAPRSRGSVTLASADPGDAPRIDLGLLSDREGADRRALVAALRLARRVAAQSPFRAHITEETQPGPDVQSDEALFAHACRELQTVYHPAGACRMGSDSAAVVGPDLKAHGLGGLWVADASVMPTVPRGHPNAAVAMIAERAARVVRAV